MKVKYRTWGYGIPPKTIKLDIPGWAGDHRNHTDGCTPQPWHCIPFVEGSTYGLELKYPFHKTISVINDGKTLEFKHEGAWTESESVPFSCFAPTARGGHYGFTSSLDIQVPDGHVLRLEPHPRFFTDSTGTCPIVVPGHIHPWWCRIFFVVFKAPFPGETHVFKHDEPYAQILVVPSKIRYELTEMTFDEKAERVTIENKIHQAHGNSTVAKNVWKDNLGNKFDDKYKQLQNAYNKGGWEGIRELLNKVKYGVPDNLKKIGKFVKNETLQNQEKHTKIADSDIGSERSVEKTEPPL